MNRTTKKGRLDSALLGFYLTLYREPLEEVVSLVQSIRNRHPRSKILVASDHGSDFSTACHSDLCMAWEYNERINTARKRPPHAFTCTSGLMRLAQALRWLQRPWVVVMDSDVRVMGTIQHAPMADLIMIGNVRNRWRRNLTRLIARSFGYAEHHMGYACGGAAIIRSARILHALALRLHERHPWKQAVALDPIIEEEIDPCLCATCYLTGLRLNHWNIVLQFGGDYWELGWQDYPQGVGLLSCGKCIAAWKDRFCHVDGAVGKYVIDTCSAQCPPLLHDVKGDWCDYDMKRFIGN